jgi:hypothetical protein
MGPLLGAAAIFDFGQALLQLYAIHTALLPKPSAGQVYCRFLSRDSRCLLAKVTAVTSLRWFFLLLAITAQAFRPFRPDSS